MGYYMKKSSVSLLNAGNLQSADVPKSEDFKNYNTAFIGYKMKKPRALPEHKESTISQYCPSIRNDKKLDHIWND